MIAESDQPAANAGLVRFVHQRCFQVQDHGLVESGLDGLSERKRQVDSKWLQGGCRWASRVDIRKRQRVPVQAHVGQLPVDGAKVPDVNGRPVIGGYHQPCSIRAEAGRPDLAQVGALETSNRPAVLALDQTEHLGRVDHDRQVTIG